MVPKPTSDWKKKTPRREVKNSGAEPPGREQGQIIAESHGKCRPPNRHTITAMLAKLQLNFNMR